MHYICDRNDSFRRLVWLSRTVKLNLAGVECKANRHVSLNYVQNFRLYGGIQKVSVF